MSIFQQMSHGGGAPALPVSATQPDQQFFIQGLPGNIPFQPPYQPQNQVQNDLFPMAIGLFLQQLQDNAGRNAPRTFAFNQMSQNAYQNAEFASALESVVEFAEMLVMTRGYSPQEAVGQATEEMARIISCMYAAQFPALMQMVPPGGEGQVQNDMQRGDQIRAAVEAYRRGQQGGGGGFTNATHPRQMQQQGQHPQQPQFPQQAQYSQQPQQPSNWSGQQSVWSGNPQPQQQGGPFGNRGGMQSQHSHGVMPGMTHQRPNMGMSGGGGGMFQDNQPQQPSNTVGGVRGSSLGRRKHSTVTQSMSGGRYEDHRTPQQVQQDQQRTTNMGDYGHQVQTPVQPTPRNVEMTTGPSEDFSDSPFPTPKTEHTPSNERSWDYRSIDGAEAQPAHLSNWEVTWSEERPYKIAYDPSTQVKFHIRDREGRVMEEIVPKDSTMEYFNHEVKTHMRSNLPPVDDGKVIPADELLGTGKEVYKPKNVDDVDEATLQDIRKSKAPLVLPEIFSALTSQEAYCKAFDLLKNSDMEDQWSKRPIQYAYRQVIPVPNTKVMHASGEDIDLNEVLNATLALESVSEYHRQLVKLTKDKTIPRRVIHLLNENSTRVVNDALSAGLGLDWDIDSFLEDWDDLSNAFVENLGDEQGPALRNKMLARYGSKIVGGGLRVLEGEAHTEAFSKTGALSHFHNSKDNMVVLCMLRTETHVPFDASEISLNVQGEVCEIRESELPTLHKAVSDYVKRAKDNFLDNQRITIVTRDNVGIEVFEGALNREFLILKSVGDDLVK